MPGKTTSKKQLKLFRVERFMDQASEPDNLTPPKSKKIDAKQSNNDLTIKPLLAE